MDKAQETHKYGKYKMTERIDKKTKKIDKEINKLKSKHEMT